MIIQTQDEDDRLMVVNIKMLDTKRYLGTRIVENVYEK